MIDPVKTVMRLQPGLDLGGSSFPANSRYNRVGTAIYETHDGRKIIYLRRRFISPPEKFALIQEHTVVQGDRPDLLASKYLGDSEQFWRICDANAVMDPGDLTANIASKIRITMPEGLTGVKFG
jgi:hypothetical protein